MVDRQFLEELYARYNRRELARRDPVGFLWDYQDSLQRELAGLIAAMLAYGRLEQILGSVEDALSRLGPRPREFVLSRTPQELRAAASGFTHRFVNEDRLWRLLWAAKDVLDIYGSLEECFRCHDDPRASSVLPGLQGLAAELRGAGRAPAHLVADPAGGSACKRWNLYLRWMIRRDRVDPGGWRRVKPARLIVPLDVHTWRLCTSLGLTDRKTRGMSAALEITERFRQIQPADPVKYDFALMHASEEADPLLAAHLAGLGD